MSPNFKYKLNTLTKYEARPSTLASRKSFT